MTKFLYEQVREVLYDLLKLDVAAGIQTGKTAGGVKSTCEATLKKLEPFHPIPGADEKFSFIRKKRCKNCEFGTSLW